MCVNDIRTQELPFGQNEVLFTGGGISNGVVFWPGQAALRGQPCADGMAKMLVPKVMGVAAEFRDPDGNVVSDASVVMAAYLVDNWRAQKIEANVDRPLRFAAFEALLQRKFIGGFLDGDPGTRKMYALGFGSGFPASVPDYGGSDNAYGVALLWQAPTAQVGQSMCLVDWGYDQSVDIGATGNGGGFGSFEAPRPGALEGCAS